MCCFSGPVEDVAATRIFARMRQPGRQILAYQMMFASRSPVAMILPVPTPPGSAEDAVRFIDLASYPSLFEDLLAVFMGPPPRAAGRAAAAAAGGATLEVKTVGDYVASFVPGLDDFGRLDERFQLPPGTVDAIPGYADFGFVVFQLAATGGRARAHPMAFEFPTRDTERLFFPTLHVHDGTLPGEARFDHVLYAQGLRNNRMFEHSARPVGQLGHARAMQVVDVESPLSRCEMIGTLPNRDQWVYLT